jgi:hypothetical protein
MFLQAANKQQAENIANQVLTKLYQTNGNFLFPKPKVEIISNVANVARLLRKSNIIELDSKAYQLCQTMGKDSLSALAIVLGHELAHVFQMDNSENEASFLSYSKNNKFSSDEEHADIYGAFMAHLAGFKTREIFPNLIEQIYNQYELKNKTLANYPTFEERQQTGKRIGEVINQMQIYYEAADYAMITGEYELAIALLENIEVNYKGKELYNNIGVAYSLFATSLQKTNNDDYIYPFEIDASFRLKKPKVGRGDEDDFLNKKLIVKYLKKASEYFEQAAKMDMQYIAPNINNACVLIMQNKYNEALSYISKKQMEKRAKLSSENSAYFEKVKLVKALALTKGGATNEPNALFLELANNKNKAIASIAAHNLKVLNKQNTLAQDTSVQICDFQMIVPSSVKIFRLPKTGNWSKIANNMMVSSTEDDKGLQVFFKKGQQLQFAFYRNNQTTTLPENTNPSQLTFSGNGVFYHCAENRQLLFDSNTGSVSKQVLYYK